MGVGGAAVVLTNNFLCNSAVLTMAWYHKFQGPIEQLHNKRVRSYHVSHNTHEFV